MSTKYIASNWRLPNQENSSKNDNYGLTFDGSSEFITTPSTWISDLGLSGATKASISIWVYPNDSTRMDVISNTYSGSTYSNFDIVLNRVSSGDIAIYTRTANNFYSSSSNVVVGQWNHIVVVFDASQSTAATKTKVFVNNSEITNASSTGFISVLDRSNALYIGGITNRLDGKLSQLSLFDYTLTSTQISTLYGSSSLGSGNPMILNPVAFYPLGDNSASNPLTQPNVAVEDATVFDFSGGTDSINIPDSSVLKPSTVSVSIWFKGGNQPSNYSYLLAKRYSTGGPAYGFYTGASLDKLSFLIRKGDNSGWAETNINDSGVVMDNNWHNAVGIFDGTNVKLYIDGVLKSTTTTGVSGITYGSGHLTIGALLNTGSLDFNGELSNIAVWNSDQSSETSNIYNSGVPATSYTNTPTAWYKLNNTANWEADSSGNWQIPEATSAYPQSFDFSGGSHIDCGTISSFDDGDISFSLWCKLTSTGTYQYILSSTNTGSVSGINIAMHNNTNLLFERSQDIANTQNSTGYAVPGFSYGNWHHLCATYSAASGELKSYVDGVLKSTTTDVSDPRSASSPLKIGGLSNYATLYAADGQISNVQVWNTVLTATGTDSVETLYNNGSPLTTAIASSNLKAWYKLDNSATFSTNWSVPDDSGNGNTGTSSGMTEQNLVNNNVSALNGESSGMTSANLVTSDLTRAIPYDNYSFSFDSASSDYIDLGSSNFGITATTAFTISAWINSTISGTKDILSKRETSGGYTGFTFRLNHSASKAGKVMIILDGTGGQAIATTNTDLNPNIWYNVILTSDGTGSGSGLKIYINGVDDTTGQSGTVTDISNSINTMIGSSAGLGSFFSGKISNISIFNQELTPTEVLKLYANGVPQDLSSFTPQPQAWYPLGSNSFWNGSNWICRDLIGSNDGTSANAGADAIQGDAPRSEANGTGSNMDVPSNLIGEGGQNSNNNSWSVNMSSLARVEDVA